MNVNITVHWWSKITDAARTAVHPISPRPTADDHPAPRHHASFHRFLDQSCLAREMLRL